MFLSDTNMVNWLKQTAQEGLKLLHQYGGESNYPKLMLYYTNTRWYCGNVANLQVSVILCQPEWGTVPQEMALTEQKPCWRVTQSVGNVFLDFVKSRVLVYQLVYRLVYQLLYQLVYQGCIKGLLASGDRRGVSMCSALPSLEPD